MDQAKLPEAITGISHSGFYVQDLDRTLDFYTKLLGAKLEWRNDKSENPLMKIYIGDFGLSIIKWPPNVPKFEIPHAIHWAYRVDPAKAEETSRIHQVAGHHGRRTGWAQARNRHPELVLPRPRQLPCRNRGAFRECRRSRRSDGARQGRPAGTLGLYGGDKVRATLKAGG